MVPCPNRSFFRVYLEKWRNETGRSLFAPLRRKSRERNHPRVSKIARLRAERGKHLFDIFGHVSHSSTSRRPLPSACRLAERTLSRKLLNRRRFPRSTSSSSSSSSSSSLSRIERRERESRMGCCVMGLTNDRTGEATRCHGRTFT